MKEDKIGPAEVVFDVDAKTIAEAKLRQEARESLFSQAAAG